jgi:hypothetical protein
MNTESGVPSVHTFCSDDTGIFRWFRSMIGLLEADVEPFYRVQLDFPAAPSIMINTRRIGDHYHTILNALELWLNDGELSTPVAAEGQPKTPPCRIQSVVPPRLNRHHMFFDLGDNYE